MTNQPNTIGELREAFAKLEADALKALADAYTRRDLISPAIVTLTANIAGVASPQVRALVDREDAIDYAKRAAGDVESG